MSENIIILFIFLLPFLTVAQDSTKTEKAFRIVPLVTSSPLMGLGAGLAVSYLYSTDGGWYTAGGLGVQYALQAKTGVDQRLDLVRTSENEYALYLMLNQAF